MPAKIVAGRVKDDLIIIGIGYSGLKILEQCRISEIKSQYLFIEPRHIKKNLAVDVDFRAYVNPDRSGNYISKDFKGMVTSWLELINYDPSSRIIITNGLGGRLGSVAGRQIFDDLQSIHANVYWVAGLPFRHEGKRSMEKAREATRNIAHLSNVILFDNQKIINEYGEMSADQAFKYSDIELANRIQGLVNS